MTEVVANSLVAMQELDKLQAAQGREAPSELLQRAFDVPVCLSEEDAPLEFDPVVPLPGALAPTDVHILEGDEEDAAKWCV